VFVILKYRSQVALVRRREAPMRRGIPACAVDNFLLQRGAIGCNSGSDYSPEAQCRGWTTSCYMRSGTGRLKALPTISNVLNSTIIVGRLDYFLA
jgi:hypothetical protein